MHIEPTTHEGSSAKVYTYEGDYDVSDDKIVWHARVSHPEERPRAISGTIPVTSLQRHAQRVAPTSPLCSDRCKTSSAPTASPRPTRRGCKRSRAWT